MTFPLDTFIKKEFLEEYNMKFSYKFEDKSSDMQKNLTPAAYDKSVDLAVLTSIFGMMCIENLQEQTSLRRIVRELSM